MAALNFHCQNGMSESVLLVQYGRWTLSTEVSTAYNRRNDFDMRTPNGSAASIVY